MRYGGIHFSPDAFRAASHPMLQAARARRDAVAFNRSLSEIVAPSGGIVLARHQEPGEIVDRLRPGLTKLNAALESLLRPEPRAEASGLRAQLEIMGAPRDLSDRIVRLF